MNIEELFVGISSILMLSSVVISIFLIRKIPNTKYYILFLIFGSIASFVSIFAHSFDTQGLLDKILWFIIHISLASVLGFISTASLNHQFKNKKIHLIFGLIQSLITFIIMYSFFIFKDGHFSYGVIVMSALISVMLLFIDLFKSYKGNEKGVLLIMINILLAIISAGIFAFTSFRLEFGVIIINNDCFMHILLGVLILLIGIGFKKYLENSN